MKSRDELYLPLIVISVLSIVFFFIILIDVSGNGFLVGADSWLANFLSTAHTPLLDSVLIALTTVFNTTPYIILSLVLSFLIFHRHKTFYLLWFLTSIILAIFTSTLIKSIVHRARPVGSLIVQSGFSFPSNHSIAAIVFFMVIAFAFRANIRNKFYRFLFFCAMIFSFVLIGFTRIYVGVHWFSDVIAGFCFGLFWLSFVGVVLKLFMKNRNKIRKR